MPIFDNDDSAEQFKANGSGFQFSGVGISTLGASEYTLVSVGTDRSSSVMSFADQIETCVVESFKACQRSARVDNLLARLVSFGGSDRNRKPVHEEHGFRPLADCHLGNYKGFLQPGGGTPLYDASIDLVDSKATYGKSLQAQDYTANGILIIITDGADYGSTFQAKHVKESIQRARQSEALESLVSLLIGINVQDQQIARFLADFKDEAGFDKYVEAKDASANTIAKLVDFISRSISMQSQAVGSGGPSQLITF
jgi:hypothetical protein